MSGADSSVATKPSVGDSVSGFVDRHLKQLFLGPAIIYVAVMIVFPIGYTVFLSMTNSAGAVTRPFEFVGLANYEHWLTDTRRFWPAAGRTLYYTVTAVALQLLLGLGIALLLRKPFRGQGVVRTLILLPLVATPVAVGMMWLLIFEPNIGMANEILQTLGLPAQGWLTSESQALNTLIWIDIWQWTPMMALILLAGLSVLPEEPYEAAMVDGASAWQRFRYITLPLLWPAMAAAVMLRSIDALKSFDIIYATKGRGGGSNNEAETLNILAYGESFEYSSYGSASALLMLFLMLIVVSLCLIAIGRKVGTRT